MSFMTTTSTSTDMTHSGFTGQPGTFTTGVATPTFSRYCWTPRAWAGLGAAAIQPPLTAQEPTATTALALSAASTSAVMPVSPATRRALPSKASSTAPS